MVTTARAIDPARLTYTDGSNSAVGVGATGSVVSGELVSREGLVRRVAIKLMSVSDECVSTKHAMAQHAAPFGVARLIGTCVKGEHLCLVMHRYERSLADLIDDLAPMDEGAVRAVGRALCTTLAALHDAGIVVCDFNPANVLLDELHAPFIFDFRAAVLCESERQPTSRGNVQYMAPEAFNTRPLRASDVWSLACTLLEMHTGLAPWDAMCANHAIVAVGICGRAPEVPSTMPACDVIRRCFALNPVDRPTVAELAAAMVVDK